MPRAWIVEDNELNFELLDFLLGEEGWTVERADDGDGLDALLTALPGGGAGGALPDVVLLDMNLPDVPGTELAARLRADARFERVPVIAVTAHAMRGDREKFLAAGCDDYVAKPIEAPILFAVIERARARMRT